MMIGGASLVKIAEHFPSALPIGSRVLPQNAYDATALAGTLGTLFVLSGAVAAIPGFIRMLRAKKWSEVRRIVLIAITASVVVAVTTLALSLWAHHLTNAQRNGADHWYSAAFVGFVLLVVATIGLWTSASVALAKRITFTPRELRWESGLALGVCLTSIVVVASSSMWWLQMGLHAPWFLEGRATGIATSPWSADLIVTMFVMALALMTALWGASRILWSYRRTRFDDRSAPLK
jgi:hypothetical protein